MSSAWHGMLPEWRSLEGFDPLRAGLLAMGLFAGTLGLSSRAAGQIEWHKSLHNPMVSKGAAEGWDQSAVFSPAVLREGGAFKMWYTGVNGRTYGIGHASSADGETWAKHAQNPLLRPGEPGDWDSAAVGYPAVLTSGSIYAMWYSGYDGRRWQIGFAISNDGVSWTKYPGNPVLEVGTGDAWDRNGVAGCSVLLAGGQYTLWYSGRDGNTWRVGRATSFDGLTWTKHPAPVIDVGPEGEWDGRHVLAGCVLQGASGVFQQWYVGHDGSNKRIGFATSADGIEWSKHPAPIVDIGPPGAWDSIAVDNPAVVFDGSRYRMWFSGQGPEWSSVGYASNIAAAPGKGFHRGDPNHDGKTDIADGVFVMLYLFSGGAETSCRESADANNDGRVDVADAIYLLNYIFRGGPEPESPGPPSRPCGLDPDPPGSPQDLGCELYERC
jgi:predicted GH43/DUF377 family glycosyl hydrolase